MDETQHQTGASAKVEADVPRERLRVAGSEMNSNLQAATGIVTGIMQSKSAQDEGRDRWSHRGPMAIDACGGPSGPRGTALPSNRLVSFAASEFMFNSMSSVWGTTIP